MKGKSTVRSRRLSDILAVRDAVEALLLLANSSPLMFTEEENAVVVGPSLIAGAGDKIFRPDRVVDASGGVLDADGLMARFPTLRPSTCELVYHRRRKKPSVNIGEDEPMVG